MRNTWRFSLKVWYVITTHIGHYFGAFPLSIGHKNKDASETF